MLAQKAPAIEDIDTDAVLAGVLNTTGDFDGFGVFVDGSASIVRATGEGGAAAVTTDWDAGVVTYSGAGLTSGSVNLSATGGGLLTNAQRVEELGGLAICFTGAVAGGSGTICGGVEQTQDGTWQFTDIVTIQGGPSASVVPGGSLSATRVHTDVVGSSRVVNLVREPVEWSVDSIAAPWTEMWGGLGRFLRQAHS